MYLTLFLCLSLALSATSTPLTVAPSQPVNLSSLDLGPLNTTSLSTKIGCFPFKPTKQPPLLPTNKHDCEAAIDNGIRGQSLTTLRKFARKPSSHVDDVLLPVRFSSGSCYVELNMIDADDEDTLTLAEIYAEVMGPDGVAKRCLGPGRPFWLGGRMSLGPKELLKVIVTGTTSSS